MTHNNENDARDALARVEAIIAPWPDGENPGEPFGDPRGFYLGLAKRHIRKALTGEETGPTEDAEEQPR